MPVLRQRKWMTPVRTPPRGAVKLLLHKKPRPVMKSQSVVGRNPPLPRKPRLSKTRLLQRSPNADGRRRLLLTANLNR